MTKPITPITETESKAKPEAQAPSSAPIATPDENHGRGGMYTVVNGVRKRMGGTKAADTQPKKAKD